MENKYSSFMQEMMENLHGLFVDLSKAIEKKPDFRCGTAFSAVSEVTTKDLLEISQLIRDYDAMEEAKQPTEAEMNILHNVAEDIWFCAVSLQAIALIDKSVIDDDVRIRIKNAKFIFEKFRLIEMLGLILGSFDEPSKENLNA